MTGLPADFVRAILDVEAAAALLVEARQAASAAKAREGAGLGRHCTQLVIEAAELLASLGEAAEALALLKNGLDLAGPTAPLQHAYARHSRDAGAFDEASHWLRSAMLRARPNAAMALELCEIELGRGHHAAAADALALSVRLRWLDPDGLAKIYGRLVAAGHHQAAIVPAMMLHRRGADTAMLRSELAELLHAQAPYCELPEAVIAALLLDEPRTAIRIAAASAHDRLLAGFDRTEVIGHAARREASPSWIGQDALWAFLKAKLDGGEPFSFIRVSDGEGRFVAAARRQLFPWLTEPDAQAMLDQIWMNWFGQQAGAVPSSGLVDLAERFDAAIRNADLLGVTCAGTFEHDARHFGYRAVLDRWMDQLRPPLEQHHTEAAYTVPLNREDPFLGRLLAGQRFIGAISPYDDLALRLRRQIGIPAHRDHVIPGETRLGRAREMADRGTHYPAVFDRIMRAIEVPFSGAVFLVAGGLLGKIYCNRIRALGGFAIDIGAVADRWMGQDTRGTGFAAAVPDRLP